MIFITLGFALVLSGISWMSLFGCATTLLALLSGGRFSKRQPFTVCVSYGGLFISLGGGVYQLIVAAQHHGLWLRVSPSWWFLLWLSVIWLSLVIREFRPGQPHRSA